MKLTSPPPRQRGATTIAVVLVLCVVTLLIMTATLQWSSTNTRLTERNNQYQRSVAAAEAATEKVISRIMTDYKKGGEKRVTDNMSSYASGVPHYTEDPQAGWFSFNNGAGVSGSISVQQVATSEFRDLASKYKGLRGYVTPFRIVANARQNNTMFDITAAVRQDFELTTIPLFQFAVFYNIDMEYTPAPVMDVRGQVYGNANIYLKPRSTSTLTFHENISAAGKIVLDARPGDPEEPRTPGTLVFKGTHESGANALTVPVGTNNTPAAVREIVEVPPAGESPGSEMGGQRFYNKADLIITVSNTTTKVTSGLVNNFGTVIPPSSFSLSTSNAGGFLSRVTFNNAREGKMVSALQIDIGKLKTWNETNGYIRSVISNSDVTIVYVVDYRTMTTTQAAVRVMNGGTMPTSKGLTVATPLPLYVWGNYNCPTSDLGTTNTSGTWPAALIGDAITVLSTAWTDANSTASLGSRNAGNTTVNAAFLAGIVETTTAAYSGGVENFPRFLEDWSGEVFTYNGSMVVMYPSKYAKAPWGGSNVYGAPTRRWAFDMNFRDMNKLPPGTPMSRGVVRSSWKMMMPNSTVVASP